MTDEEAVRQVRAGELDAFRAIVVRHHRPLFYFVIARIPADCEAEDIVQRTFVSAYRALASFDTSQPLLPWLRGIALNHCRNEWKRHHRDANAQSSLFSRFLAAGDAEGSVDELAGAVDGRDDDKVDALRVCLSNLTDSQQQLLRLRFVEEMPFKEIGSRLARSH